MAQVKQCRQPHRTKTASTLEQYFAFTTLQSKQTYHLIVSRRYARTQISIASKSGNSNLSLPYFLTKLSLVSFATPFTQFQTPIYSPSFPKCNFPAGSTTSPFLVNLVINTFAFFYVSPLLLYCQSLYSETIRQCSSR